MYPLYAGGLLSLVSPASICNLSVYHRKEIKHDVFPLQCTQKKNVINFFFKAKKNNNITPQDGSNPTESLCKPTSHTTPCCSESQGL